MPYNLRISILRKEPLMCVFHPLIEMDVVFNGVENTIAFTCKSVLNRFWGENPAPLTKSKWWPDWFKAEEIEFCDLQYRGRICKKADITKLFYPFGKTTAHIDEASVYIHGDLEEEEPTVFSCLRGWEEGDHYVKDIRMYYSVCENKKEVLEEKKKVDIGGFMPFCIPNECDFPDLKLKPDSSMPISLELPEGSKCTYSLYCFIYPNQNKRREFNDVLLLNNIRKTSFVAKTDVGSTLKELNDYYYDVQRKIRKEFERKYKRSSADAALERFFEAARKINSDPEAMFTVRDVVIFGSYVNTNNERIGDIDIAVGYTEHIEKRKRNATYADVLEIYRKYDAFWSALKVSPIIELHSLDDYLNVCKTYNVPIEELLNKHRAYSVNQNEELVPCLLKNVLENYIATKCKGVKTPSTAFAESSLGKLYRNE